MTTILLVVIAIEFGALLVVRIWEVRRLKDTYVVDRKDLDTVLMFVIGRFSDYHYCKWYAAAERLTQKIWKEKTLRKSGGKP